MADKVLVTGANGFIGKHLVRRLVRDGYDVSVIVGREPDKCSYSECTVYVSGDRSNESILNFAKKINFSSIFHLAAYGVRPDHRSNQEMYNTNVVLSLALAEIAADKNARFVFAGSSAEYAKPASDGPIAEGASLNFHGMYGASKAAATMLLSAYAHSVNLQFCSLRLFNVYGPGEADHRLFKSLATSLASGQHTSLSAGTQIRDFIHVDDVIDAFIQANLKLKSRNLEIGAYNIATGVGTSVQSFAEAIADFLDVKRSLLGFGELEFRPDDLPVLIGDSSKFQNETDWKPKYSIQSGIEKSLGTIRSEQSV